MKGLSKIAIVAYSFGLREGDEPSPCNWRLAAETKRMAEKYRAMGYEVFIVAQWEVALALRQLGCRIDHVVERGESYLDSEGVWEEAKERVLFPNRIIQAIPVVQPVLQRFKVIRMMKHDTRVVKERTRWIGFDRHSDQPWCRGMFGLLKYSLKQLPSQFSRP